MSTPLSSQVAGNSLHQPPQTAPQPAEQSSREWLQAAPAPRSSHGTGSAAAGAAPPVQRFAIEIPVEKDSSATRADRMRSAGMALKTALQRAKTVVGTVRMLSITAAYIGGIAAFIASYPELVAAQVAACERIDSARIPAAGCARAFPAVDGLRIFMFVFCTLLMLMDDPRKPEDMPYNPDPYRRPLSTILVLCGSPMFKKVIKLGGICGKAAIFVGRFTLVSGTSPDIAPLIAAGMLCAGVLILIPSSVCKDRHALGWKALLSQNVAQHSAIVRIIACLSLLMLAAFKYRDSFVSNYQLQILDILSNFSAMPSLHASMSCTILLLAVQTLSQVFDVVFAIGDRMQMCCTARSHTQANPAMTAGSSV